jgi:hypothetical protein
MGIETILVLIALFIGVVAGVVFMTQGQRRIPTQSAKHVRGRRVYGGTRQYLPLRVNQAGVMPIIFASSLLLFPQFLFQYLSRAFPESDMLRGLYESFTRGQSYLYNVVYIALIYFFCYFWTAITFNPKEMADNLKNFGAFIPGYRPGKRTADYLERVMERITYVGGDYPADWLRGEVDAGRASSIARPPAPGPSITSAASNGSSARSSTTGVSASSSSGRTPSISSGTNSSRSPSTPRPSPPPMVGPSN